MREHNQITAGRVILVTPGAAPADPRETVLKTTRLTLALAATLLLTAVAPASAAVPETELRPARLERGPDIAMAHLEGKTVVDGDTRLRIRAGMVTLLGTSGGSYVVGTSDKTGSKRFRTFRITPEGDRTPLLRGVAIFEQVLSGDGARIGLATGHNGERSRVRVWDAFDGHLESDRRFPGSVMILDLEGDRMLLGSWGPNATFWWNVASDTTRRILGRTGYNADIGADLLAFYTGDPYRRGCSVTARLSAVHTRLWKSCDERVQTFAANGRRAATIHILTDGLGPNQVHVRRTTGRLLARYTVDGWFGALTWESAQQLLLDTHGSEKSATVRCRLTDCERATGLRTTQPPRVQR
ncbi:MAG: hypothetical protein JWO76_2678 [Nocardioides sp.]|nr:hypothetical protein [Nocardioides sp.]